MAVFGIGKKNKPKVTESDPKVSVETRKKDKGKTPLIPAENGASNKSSLETDNFLWVLLRPRITEKATIEMERGMYTFEISPRASKRDVARAVKQLYKVEPKKVRVVTLPSVAFVSRMRGTRGVKSGVKKAYVFLKDGDRIELV